ncbi:MAG: hypothetical protein NW223_22645, partial [Hyphomicrobiaceae bacterium]|nr:hypothetical protein [Hyphomicrobiaceae bacterium]
MDDNFRSTIFGTHSPGGHVLAARVPELKALLLCRRRDLILAWSDTQAVACDELEAMSAADFRRSWSRWCWRSAGATGSSRRRRSTR